MQMTARELAELSRADLRASYQNLRKITSSRVSTFEKHGAIEAVPQALRQRLPSSRGLSDEDVLQSIRETLGWIRGKRSTYSGYQATQEDFRSKMQESMPDLDLSTPEKMKDFGEFMGEMQQRYGEMWHRGISNQARDIYRDMVKLNKDPRKFMQNYDFWKQNVEAVNKEKELTRAGGRRRSTTMSTYLNQLKRGKIK